MKGLLALLCIFLFVYGYNCCSSGWHSHSGSCFKIYPERTSWNSAKASCLHHGAELAEDHDHSTHSFLVNLIKNDPSYRSSNHHHTGSFQPIYCIGATDHNLDYDWQWASTGKVVYPEMFGVHQPDRYMGSNQECLAINVRSDWSESSNWDDVSCGSKHYMYICEKKDSGHGGSHLIG
ncbi:lactose-binding lectin l-2-like [Mytilus trossulus]|uniref:lactose-binding lectin l-2-like n=1 Tax=Mytilus trossulus TaxID=6551 RepID=UPI003004B3D9